jgi:uncharacterized membrane protein required for colicin V production
MNAFDWTIIGVVGLSMFLAFFRGVTRELIALASGSGIRGSGYADAAAWRILPEIGDNPVMVSDRIRSDFRARWCWER